MEETKEQRLSLAELVALVDDARGDCDRCPRDCRDRLKITDSQIEVFRALEDEYRGVLNEMRQMVTQLKALHQNNMRVLNIVNAPGIAGEAYKCQRSEGDHNSSQSHMLKQFAKSTH